MKISVHYPQWTNVKGKNTNLVMTQDTHTHVHNSIPLSTSHFDTLTHFHTHLQVLGESTGKSLKVESLHAAKYTASRHKLGLHFSFSSLQMAFFQSVRGDLISSYFSFPGWLFTFKSLGYMSSRYKSTEISDRSVLVISFKKWRNGVQLGFHFFPLFFLSWVIILGQKGFRICLHSARVQRFVK